MGMIAVCDGCGKQEPADCLHGQWRKPSQWFERTPLGDDRTTQLRNVTACSRACIELIAERTGQTRVVLPV